MKKLTKISLIIIAALLLVIAGLVGFAEYRISSMAAAPDINIERTPARLIRGEYLANNVMACLDCHSTRDWNLYAGPVKPGTLGAGGEKFGEEIGLPGTFYARNLTPSYLGDWTDGEIVRAITTGISKDGSPLFPIMPYHSFGKLDLEDIYAVVAYLRTLEPIENEVPASEPNLPMTIIMNMMPQEPQHVTRPARNVMPAYGEYVATAAGCADCHTPFDGGQPVAEMQYAGGREFPLPGFGTVRAPNLTPHRQSGLGGWTREMFIRRFKLYADSTYSSPSVKPGQLQTVMPWEVYAGISEDDLGAMYDFLMSIDAIDNPIEVFTASAG
jgi:hypothetical protein